MKSPDNNKHDLDSAQDTLKFFEKSLGIEFTREKLDRVVGTGNVRLKVEKLTKEDESVKNCEIAPIQEVNAVFVPPDPVEIKKKNEDEKGDFHEAEFSPRSAALIKILNKKGEEFFRLRGKNAPNMIREKSYQMFIIPNLGKMVLICDEEGNRTFVFHFLSEKPDSWFARSKDELKTFSESHPLELDHFEWIKEPEKKLLEYLFVIKNSDSLKNIDTKEILEEIQIRLQKLKTEKKKPTADLSEVKEKSLERAPENWKNASQLRKEIKSDLNTIKNFAEKYRKEHPEWFEFYTINGRHVEHYNPELVKIIREHFEKKPLAGAPVEKIDKKKWKQWSER